MTCALFLAIRTLHQLAEDEKREYPLRAAALLKDVYMDDILTGASTLDETMEIQRQLVSLCMAGGFPLKKWSFNDASLLIGLSAASLLQQEPREWKPREDHRTLDLMWHPYEDSFSVSTSSSLLHTFTRSVLSLTAKLFDPLG